MENYFDIPIFENIYLEDSYVLKITENHNKLIFDIDVVLTEKHPFYSIPKEGEKYCYKKARIIFEDIEFIEWVEKKFIPFFSSNGEKDYGNIDSFVKINGVYLLSGDWGEVRIKCRLLQLEFFR